MSKLKAVGWRCPECKHYLSVKRRNRPSGVTVYAHCSCTWMEEDKKAEAARDKWQQVYVKEGKQ